MNETRQGTYMELRDPQEGILQSHKPVHSYKLGELPFRNTRRGSRAAGPQGSDDERSAQGRRLVRKGFVWKERAV